MAEVNWGLLNQGGNNALDYFNVGQKMGSDIRESRDARERKNALSAFVANPDDPNALKAIADSDPELAYKLGQQRQNSAAQAQQSQTAGVKDIARLFNGVTPENYASRIGAAQQLGLDVSKAPPQFDPAWVEQNAVIANAFAEKPEQASGIARELVDAGYQPGTPEFNTAMRGVIENKYASDYVDEGGNTRRRSALQLGGIAPPAQGGAVRVNTPEDAMKLPPGTQFISPDGRIGTVPGGQTVSPSGNFPPAGN